MLKASALYLVIVIALVMAVICSSLIAAAYFYKLQYQKTFRSSQLQNNLASGINILLGSKADLSSVKTISLFGIENDTVVLQRHSWGIFEIGTAKAFVQQDTIAKAFTIGNQLDSARWSALYIIDEDRNISVSGKTSITGNAFIPKAGIKEAYVNNQAYQGDKRLVIGDKKNSSRTLPALDQSTLLLLQKRFKEATVSSDLALLQKDSLEQSFLKPTLQFNLGKKPYNLTNNLSGNIILYSDSLITIDSSAKLNNVIIFSKGIKVLSGFQGSCQLFATDSIQIEDNCRFDYPSAIGVVNFDEKAQEQRSLIVGSKVTINGILFISERAKNDLLPVISFGKDASVNGQVYSQGLLNYQDGLTINGSMHTSRFLYQASYTRYENYLINMKISSSALSPYYLTGKLLPASGKSTRVLQWLK